MASDRGNPHFDCSRRGFLSAVAAAGIATPARTQTTASGQPVICRVVDRDSGRPVPARVRLVDEHSNEVVPLGHAPALAEDAQEGDVRFQGRRYSYVDGEFQVDPRRLRCSIRS
jgi:hypothetical protein